MNAASSQTKVLVVDDYAPARYARCKVLRQAGFTVLEASTGRGALDLIAAERPQLVLLDINLPDINGYEVCRAIKRNEGTASIQVLHVSGSCRDSADYTRGLEEGADGYLVEPVEPAVLVATVRSLVRVREAEEAAQTAARGWQRTFEAITDGVCVVDSDGRIVRHNPRFLDLVGQSESVVGHDAVHAFRPVLGGREDELRSMLTSPVHGVLELGGDPRWLQIRTAPLQEGPRPTGGAVCIVADVSERRRVESMTKALLEMEQRARAAAEASNDAKDEFLAVLSHELRTPLTAMLGWLTMLNSGRLNASSTAHAIQVIERNTRLQAAIVEDLLDVSRIISGKMTLEPAVVDLAPVLRAAVEASASTAAGKAITIDLDFELEAPPAVLGDAARLEQVFTNLVSNAVKFTPEGGAVRVSAAADEESAVISVSDTGVGIEPGLLPYVFEPFRQAEGTRRRRHTGLGLGLAIVRHLVELHGGVVRVHSEGLGHGATFSVRLPRTDRLVPPVVTPTRAALAPGRDVTLAGVRVLLVEDEDDTREIIEAMLRVFGAEVRGVGNADAALEALHDRRPDIVISDIGLPDRDGYEFIRAVRGLPTRELASVPAIALTAFAQHGDETSALAAGFDRHLAKPIEPESLTAAVAQLLARSVR